MNRGDQGALFLYRSSVPNRPRRSLAGLDCTTAGSKVVVSLKSLRRNRVTDVTFWTQVSGTRGYASPFPSFRKNPAG